MTELLYVVPINGLIHSILSFTLVSKLIPVSAPHGTLFSTKNTFETNTPIKKGLKSWLCFHLLCAKGKK